MGSPFTNLITRTPLDPTGAYEWDYQIPGYWIFRLLTLPAILQGSGADAVAMALCTGAAFPEYTMEFSDRTGIGGIKVSIPTKFTVGDTIEFKFNDIAPNNTPTLMQYFAQWFNSIRNMWTGTADPKNSVTQNQYKTIALLVATDPTFTIPYIAIKFFGLVPATLPYSNYVVDVNTNELFEYTIQCRVDRPVPVGNTDTDVTNTIQAAQSYIQSTAVTIPATLPG